MDNRCDVIFRGEIAGEEDMETVKKRIATMYKTDEKNIEKFFSGQSHTIKKGIDLATGEKIRAAFLKAGAICHVKKNIPEGTGHSTSANSGMPDINNLKDNISKTVSEVSNQMKPGFDEAKEKASQAFATASQSIKSDLESGNLKALIRNKYVAASIAACFFLMFIFFGTPGSGGGAMPLTMENIELWGEIMETMPYQLTEDQVQQMQNDPKLRFEFMYVNTFEHMGYDFEASMYEISADLLSGDLYGETYMAALAILMIPAQERNELYEEGIISKEVKLRLDKFAQKTNL